jgi:predicted dehydrogenase
MSKLVEVCLVGAGRVAKVHANSLGNHVPGGKLVVFVDSVPETLRATTDHYGVEARFNSLEGGLGGIEFDAVVITRLR